MAFRCLKSAMTSVSDICSELADIQPCLLSDSYAPEVKGKMVNSVRLKVVGLKAMTASTAHALMSQIHSMKLEEAYLKKLEDAINKRLMEPASASKDETVQQLLIHVLNYLTSNDWLQLEDPTSIPEADAGVIAQRFSKLGIRNFDEQTYRWLLAVVLAMYLKKQKAWPKYQVVCSWLTNFKTHYACSKVPWEFDVIQHYPPSPTMLPDDVFAHAYPDPTDPPVQKVIENLAQLSNHIILRKNNSLLVKEIDAEKRLAAASVGMGFVAA